MCADEACFGLVASSFQFFTRLAAVFALAWQLPFCFVEFSHRRGRDLPELNLALGVDVVVTASYAGQLAGIDSGNVGELSTRPVLRRNYSCDVRTLAERLSQFGLACLIQMGQNRCEQVRVLHGRFARQVPDLSQLLDRKSVV